MQVLWDPIQHKLHSKYLKFLYDDLMMFKKRPKHVAIKTEKANN